MGDGSQPERGLMDTLLNVGKRVLTGESIFLTHFTNGGGASGASPSPRRIPARSSR